MDSAQILGLAPANARVWIDLGSGGGFPGAVVAILAAEQQPDLRITLVEADQRKSTFLRAVARETSTPMNVISDRAESLQPLDADVLSARALAPLSTLLSFAHLHMKRSGVALFPKGATAVSEVAVAREGWTFDYEAIRSETSEQSVVLRIGDIERA